MEAAAIERRAHGGPRILLDVPVELAHAGYDESFLADSVNVGPGGLSMRAPYLPDVGERLTCRFGTDDGISVNAEAEVVWADANNGHEGEFGLRFVDLTPDAHRALRSILVGSYVPPAPPDAAPGRTVERPAERTVEPVEEARLRIQLDGVQTPVSARVLHRDGGGVTVEQELPFLRLLTGIVDDGGRRGHIQSVDLVVEDGIPRLLLDLAYDGAHDDGAHDDGAHDDGAHADRAHGDGAPDEIARELAAPRDDATWVDAEPAAEPSPGVDTLDTAWAGDSASRESTLPDASAQPEAPPEVAVRATGRQAAGLDDVDEPSTDHEVSEEPDDEAREDAKAFRRSLLTRPLAERAFTALPFDAAKLRAAAARLGPHLEVVKLHILRVAAVLRARFGPLAIRSYASGRTQLRALWLLFARRMSPRLAKKRRTTAPVARESNLTGVAKFRRARPEAAAHVATDGRTPRRFGRWVLAAVLGVAALALGAYAMWGEPEVEAAVPPIATLPAPGSTEVSATPGVNGDAPASASDSLPAAPAELPMPRALAAASREAGPIAPPTFPSLRDGARPQAPQVVPAGSPYAVDVRAGRAEPSPSAGSGGGAAPSPGVRMFGEATVDNGETFLIRMSRPVETVEGEALDNGFRISVPGSLSLDRAGPIARQHALVDRSMILNRGDHAELTVHFVEGSRPAYRVQGRGSALEIVIARRR
jgi:hypothetical protein